VKKTSITRVLLTPPDTLINPPFDEGVLLVYCIVYFWYILVFYEIYFVTLTISRKL
jgi:hypothetical protein